VKKTIPTLRVYSIIWEKLVLITYSTPNSPPLCPSGRRTLSSAHIVLVCGALTKRMKKVFLSL
jgi:hypothetical protein